MLSVIIVISDMALIADNNKTITEKYGNKNCDIVTQNMLIFLLIPLILTYQQHRLVLGQLVTGPVLSLEGPLGYLGQAEVQEEKVSIHQTQVVGSQVLKVKVHQKKRRGETAVHPAAPSSRGKVLVRHWGLPHIFPHPMSLPDYPARTRAVFWTRFAFGGDA